MGITLRLRMEGDTAWRWLPVAKAHLAAINARAGASMVRNVLNYPEAQIVVTRGTVVDQIDIKVGGPYIYGFFVYRKPDNDLRVGNARVGPEDAYCFLIYNFKRIPRFDPEEPVRELNRQPFVGDGFVLEVLSNRQQHSQRPQDMLGWPVLTKVGTETYQYLGGEEGYLGHSTSFADVAAITGVYNPGYNIFGCGYQDKDHRFKYGFCGLVPSESPDPDNPGPATPIMFIGGTKVQNMVQVPYPRADFPNRHMHFTMNVAGPGHLMALHGVYDQFDPQMKPWVAVSRTWGDTWGAENADWLVPYIEVIPASPPSEAVPEPRPHWGTNLFTMVRNNTMQYVGKKTQLWAISAGLRDMLGPDGAARFCPMLFRGSDGGGWTRIAWPPDDWLMSSDGTVASPGTSYITQFQNRSDIFNNFATQDLHGGQMGFGEGCMCLHVILDGHPRFLVTQDFGDTWRFVEVPTSPTSGCSIIATMVKPQQGTGEGAEPGRVLIALPDYDKRTVQFYFTTGKFDKFTKTGGTIKPRNGLGPADSLGANRTFTNYGGTKYTPHVFPAFPGEFEPKEEKP